MLINLNDLQSQDFVLDKSEDYTFVYVGKDDSSYASAFNFVVQKIDIASKLNFKVVLYDSASLDLDINLLIPKGAKNADIYLKAQTLLIGENSSAKITPKLEIKENEVKAGHGITIGSIDDNILTYLQSRGVDQRQAEEIVVEGFLQSL